MSEEIIDSEKNENELLTAGKPNKSEGGCRTLTTEGVLFKIRREIGTTPSVCAQTKSAYHPVADLTAAQSR